MARAEDGARPRPRSPTTATTAFPGDDGAAARLLVRGPEEWPDKNTYLVLKGQTGPDAEYDYGTHFVFDCDEAVPGSAGSITRVNLDADAAHKVTLWAVKDQTGGLPVLDGSTWDPFAERLLFTAERGATTGGVWQSTIDFPPKVEDISGVLGPGGLEGIQADSDGNSGSSRTWAGRPMRPASPSSSTRTRLPPSSRRT